MSEARELQESLTLNDGTVLNGHALETETRLFLYIYGMTMAEVFEQVNDPEKTKKITAERYGEKQTIRGYKVLISISLETNGMISASLKK